MKRCYQVLFNHPLDYEDGVIYGFRVPCDDKAKYIIDYAVEELIGKWCFQQKHGGEKSQLPWGKGLHHQSFPPQRQAAILGLSHPKNAGRASPRQKRIQGMDGASGRRNSIGWASDIRFGAGAHAGTGKRN